MELPSIDVVIPVSRAWMIPYLRNTLRSIEWQSYPRELVGITVSLVVDDEDDDFSELLDLCIKYDATLVCTHPSDPAFNIAKAYNVAARKGAREAVACLDADVVWHPSTFGYAVDVLRRRRLAILPVVRSRQNAAGPLFAKTLTATTSEGEWNRLTDGMGCRRDANGNIMVSRQVYEYLHGYDERFYGWGACDHDFFMRANAHAGSTHLMDTNCPRGFHQAHPQRPDVESQNTRRNRSIMASSRTKVRNRELWGGVPVKRVLP